MKIANEMLVYSVVRTVKALKLAPNEKVRHNHSERKMQKRLNCGEVGTALK